MQTEVSTKCNKKVLVFEKKESYETKKCILKSN